MSGPKRRFSLEGPSKGHSRSNSGQLSVSMSPSSSRKPSLDISAKPKDKIDHHFISPDTRWETSVGNIEDARVMFDVIARAVEDAVYLDEDAYKEVAPTMQFTKVIRAQHRKIEHLEAELRETKARLEESNAIQTEALQRHAEMQQEIENNAVVFQMHYKELLSKEEEIQKLTAVIQALSGR